MNDDINERSVNPLIRIAETLEEILRLVKADQEKMAKRFPDTAGDDSEDRAGHF